MEIYLITRSDGKLMGVEIDGKKIYRNESGDPIATYNSLAQDVISYFQGHCKRKRWEDCREQPPRPDLEKHRPNVINLEGEEIK